MAPSPYALYLLVAHMYRTRTVYSLLPCSRTFQVQITKE